MAIKTIFSPNALNFNQFEIKTGPTTLNSLVQFKIKIKRNDTQQIKYHKFYMND